MRFTDHQLQIEIAGKPVTVIVKADLLHLLWGADTGPQTAAGIIDDNLGLIRALAEQKGGDPVTIWEADYEGDVDPLNPEESHELYRRMHQLRDAQKGRLNQPAA